MKYRKDLSVVIPLYNESSRLFHLTEIIGFFDQQSLKYEIVLVNDGSTDSTLKNLKKLLWDKSNIKIITYTRNRGKGYAIKQGVKNSIGNHILFMDIDLSTPLKEFNKFKKFFGRYDLIIGSRKRSGAKVTIRQNLIRENLGKGFTLLSQTILGVKISDFTCGFKCFSLNTAKDLFGNLTIERWGFDSEILFLAQKRNFKIKEVPVSWKNDPRTKVKFPQDLINSFRELVQIRLNDFKKYYD